MSASARLRFALGTATCIPALACGERPPVRPPAAAVATPSPDPSPAPRADGRLPPGVVPTAYTLELTVDPAQPKFLGRSRIAVRVEKPTRAIVLHGRALELQTMAIETQAGKLWARGQLRPAAGSKDAAEELVLVFEREVPAGDAVLDLQYAAPFSEGLRGLYRVQEGGRWYAFTQFEPNDARRAFPCFDEPAFKVPITLSVTVPEGQIAIANMPLSQTAQQPDAGLVTHAFAPSPPMPTYLVALAVGPLELTPETQQPGSMRVATVAGKSGLSALALEAASAELPLLSEYFGEPYPYPKLDLVAVPSFASGAMENPGLVTFREELLLLDPKSASDQARRGLAGIMAHELAHMWFGNLVTMQWWDDVWLNEAFATWMANKIVDQFRPEYGARLEAVARKLEVMNLDALRSARKVRQPVRSTSEALEAFDGITYTKGMSVLEMLENWLGEQTFQRGLRSYIAKHRWKNASAADLTAALAEASGKELGAVMDSFVDQTGVPLLEIELDCGQAKPGAAAKPVVHLSQREYRPIGGGASAGKAWRFPACIRYEAPKAPGQSCALVEGALVDVPLSVNRCPRWVAPNAHEAGYFRWQLGLEPLLALSAQALRVLDARERVGLVAGSWALVKSGDLEVDAFFRVLQALRKEDNRVVWEQMVEALLQIERSFLEEAVRPAFRRWVSEQLGPAARKVGAKPKPGDTHDTKLLRRTLLRALGDLAQDPWALEPATEQAERWLVDPASVDADIAAISLVLRARAGDAALFERILARFRAADTPERRVIALGGLTAFRDPKLVERTLSLVLDRTIQTRDLRYVFSPLFERRAAREATYRWLEAHFSELERVVPPFVLGRLVWIMANMCNRARVIESRAFFEPRVSKVEGAAKHLSQAFEAGELCAALAEVQTAKVTQFLSDGGKG